MIRLATVFSGIGAVEHALNRMGLDNEIVFACDNGDIDIFSKKIDVDEFQELAAQFNIRAVPTLVLFKDGQVVTTGSGFRPLASLEQFVAQAK